MFTAISKFFHITLYTPLYNALIFLAWLLPGHNIGWAIVLLTIIIRAALLPNSIKAARAQFKFQALQPKINEIRKRHKDDQAEQSRALMALYKEEGASPFGSCLPQLVQLPILWVLYRVFLGGIHGIDSSLLYSFTPHPVAINSNFYGLDLTKPELWVLPVLAGLSQLVLSRMMPKPPKMSDNDNDPAAMMTSQMMYIFPVMSFLFARMFPAALAIYWVATTLFGIGQQWYINKEIKVSKSEIIEAEKELVALEQAEEGKREERRLTVGERGANSRGLAERGEKPKKDLLTKMMDRRLNKAEKKSDVSVTIRKKGEK
jgi:YidC/Oxa1 family membrane protein insertase